MLEIGEKVSSFKNQLDQYIGTKALECPSCPQSTCAPCPTQSSCKPKCPDGWTYYSGTKHCYKVQTIMGSIDLYAYTLMAYMLIN